MISKCSSISWRASSESRALIASKIRSSLDLNKYVAGQRLKDREVRDHTPYYVVRFILDYLDGTSASYTDLGAAASTGPDKAILTNTLTNFRIDFSTVVK